MTHTFVPCTEGVWGSSLNMNGLFSVVIERTEQNERIHCRLVTREMHHCVRHVYLYIYSPYTSAHLMRSILYFCAILFDLLHWTYSCTHVLWPANAKCSNYRDWEKRLQGYLTDFWVIWYQLLYSVFYEPKYNWDKPLCHRSDHSLLIYWFSRMCGSFILHSNVLNIIAQVLLLALVWVFSVLQYSFHYN